jgi:hypothetical protein
VWLSSHLTWNYHICYHRPPKKTKSTLSGFKFFALNLIYKAFDINFLTL